MNEDQVRTRLGNGPNNLAILRRMVLNLWQKDKAKGTCAAIQMRRMG